jgi:DNA-binding NarL/FixJ family response regulator
MAHSQSGAIDMARQYQPDVAILVRSLVATDGEQLLSDLIKAVSLATQIIIANDSQAATAGGSQN